MQYFTYRDFLMWQEIAKAHVAEMRRRKALGLAPFDKR